MNDTTRPNFQGWYCVIEDHPHIPGWVDIRFPKTIDPEKLEGSELELVTREVCDVLRVDYKNDMDLSWEERKTENEEADIEKYDLLFKQEGNKLCRIYP